jgi:hypothetical protein
LWEKLNPEKSPSSATWQLEDRLASPSLSTAELEDAYTALTSQTTETSTSSPSFPSSPSGSSETVDNAEEEGDRRRSVVTVVALFAAGCSECGVSCGDPELKGYGDLGGGDNTEKGGCSGGEMGLEDWEYGNSEREAVDAGDMGPGY